MKRLNTKFRTVLAIFGLMGQIAWSISILSFCLIRMACIMTFFGSSVGAAVAVLLV